jgi:hypothetical protein
MNTLRKRAEAIVHAYLRNAAGEDDLGYYEIALVEAIEELHAQCPACFYHERHDPTEWFSEEARLRGWVRGDAK